MSKQKTSEEAKLKHNLIIRVNDNTYQKLNKLLAESDCQSLAEVARKILNNQKINCFYRDISLNAPMEEMALIRKELKAIGININQQTRYFNASKSEAEKKYHADQTIDLYQIVEERWKSFCSSSVNLRKNGCQDRNGKKHERCINL